MSLFKRIILSLFPEQFQGTVNSIGVFLGLINTKLFFTVINKRMVENPKLNQFDIGLDTVETKIGFGNEAHIKPKDLDLYFSYCAAANMNGHKFYSITTIGAMSSIAFSPYFINDFPRNKKGTDHYMIFLICINIVSYLFGSRIKVFPPHMNDDEAFHRCIEVFFVTYRYLLQAYSVKATDVQFEALKNTLLVHIDVFFSLYMIYKRINTLLRTNHYDEDFLQWMYSQEIKKNKSNQTKLNEFISCYQEYKHESAFRGFEDTLLDIIMPAEIMIKLLYNREDVFLISERIIPAIYTPSSIEKHIAHTMTHKDQYVDKLLEYIMDHKPRKEYFFPTVKKMVVEAFHENRFGDEAVEEWLSSISDGSSLFTIPHQLKKEGMMMDRLLNFYVGLLGTFWIGRGDSLELRLCYPDIFTHHQEWSGGRESMNYCNTYLHTWNKNAFFYKTIFDGVRSGKQSFLIPYTAQVKEVYNYGYIIEQMHQSSLAVILQDFLTNDIKLSIHQESIIKQFEGLHGQTIQSMIELNQVSFIEQYYHHMESILYHPVLVQSGLKITHPDGIKNLKDQIYSLEYRIIRDMIGSLPHQIIKDTYNDIVILHIIATLKDTLVGFLFLMTATLMKEKEKGTGYEISSLIHVYLKDVLMLSNSIINEFTKALHIVYDRYHELVQTRMKIDDNHYFLDVGVDCWWIYLKKESYHIDQLTTEDILRFRGYLKHITYYNKRTIIPKLH